MQIEMGEGVGLRRGETVLTSTDKTLRAPKLGYGERVCQRISLKKLAGLEPAAPCLQSSKSYLLNLAGADANR
jgi:hypothetical protein